MQRVVVTLDEDSDVEVGADAGLALMHQCRVHADMLQEVIGAETERSGYGSHRLGPLPERFRGDRVRLAGAGFERLRACVTAVLFPLEFDAR